MMMEKNIKLNSCTDIRLIQGNFLVSTPLLIDPLFEKSLIFMSEFKEGGAYGFLVDYILQDSTLLRNIKKKIHNSIFSEVEIFLGGPVNPDHCFLVHSNDIFIQNSLQVSDSITVTNLFDAIDHFHATPAFYKIFAGYCYWRIGQLEDEIKKGFWLVKEFSNSTLFIKSKQKWLHSIESFNINLKKFSLSSGVA